eukprot:755674-Hanusia_phi.AAC.1
MKEDEGGGRREEGGRRREEGGKGHVQLERFYQFSPSNRESFSEINSKLLLTSQRTSESAIISKFIFSPEYIQCAPK